MPAPEGKPMTKAEILNLCDLQQSVRKRAMPAPKGKPMTKAEILNLCDLQQSVAKRAKPAPRGRHEAVNIFR